MKYVKYALAIIFVLVSYGINADARITEGDVLKMINEMEQAVISQDADKLMSNFSKDAKITLDMPTNMGGKMELDVNKFKLMLKESWAMPAKFTYEVKDVQISVDPDGLHATASDITIETIEMNGKIVASSRSKERIEIISKEGKPIITSLYGKVAM